MPSVCWQQVIAFAYLLDITSLEAVLWMCCVLSCVLWRKKKCLKGKTRRIHINIIHLNASMWIAVGKE